MLAFAITLCAATGQAQDTALQDTATYHVEFDATVRLMNARRVLNFTLIDADSAQINVVPKPHRKVITARELVAQQRSIPLNSVRTITIRERGAVGRAAGKGALIGFLIGATIGAVVARDDGFGHATRTAIGAGIFPGLIGLAIGSALGSAKVVIPINGMPRPVHITELNSYRMEQ